MKDNLMAWLGAILFFVILGAVNSLLGPLFALLSIVILPAVTFLILLRRNSKSKEEFYEDLRYTVRKISNFMKSLPEAFYSQALGCCILAIGAFFYLVTWDTENLINNSSVDAFTKLLLLNYKTHVQFFLGIVFLVLYGIHTIIKKLNEILKKCNEGDIKN
ncbi:hypothetical protein [Polynucleobacter sp. JS-Fieb-80-E5]|uniref:hypothetical protein n=1 Tax=Polynucleobacter sp. JS-Fieb-80-E5 TaxID=2081050 RepID=UPI001C0DE241|nr:hypothetical protein [Polynucleobacter sp. JS-Fieb-80-E5]MBU3618880.1 hypothetical protein [Polynucleobacter sp. JS-Fieb-80-E5]